MTDMLNRLKGIRKSGDGWTARCLAHDDKQNSLSIHHRDGKWLLRCHAGCNVEEITKALGLKVADLFDDTVGGTGDINPSSNRATVQPPGLNARTIRSRQAVTRRVPSRLRII